jgi:hypothetical protein
VEAIRLPATIKVVINKAFITVDFFVIGCFSSAFRLVYWREKGKEDLMGDC